MGNTEFTVPTEGEAIEVDEVKTPDNANLSPSLIRTMAVACGMSVANLYYNQPLLAQIARDFKISQGTAGWIPLLTQLGTATGMLLFVPLGDSLERRRLIVILLLCVSVALTAAALAPSFLFLAAASLAIGLCTVVPHLIVPFAAQLAAPAVRGRAVGSVMSGLLIGILLARTVSGYVGALFGWRVMYGIATVLMLALAAALSRLLPQSVPTVTMRYREILTSLAYLIRTQPVLRRAALIGAMVFGAFSAFWTTLVFLLERAPYAYPHPSEAAGLFGLVGVVGAAAAPLVGKIADRRNPRVTSGITLATGLVSFGVFWLLGRQLGGLVLGVILLDFGVQGAHVSNQTRIYSLLPEARSRLNTVYMVTYFLGGAIGSAFGSLGWSYAHWPGVCMVGLLLFATALIVWATESG